MSGEVRVTVDLTLVAQEVEIGVSRFDKMTLVITVEGQTLASVRDSRTPTAAGPYDHPMPWYEGG
jgi:hypothetical protein